MRRVAAALVLGSAAALAAAAPLGAQSALAARAAALRNAWAAHDASGFLGTSAGIVLSLPGAEPAGATPRDQAEALLERYWRGARELGVRVAAVREVTPGVEGFVELERRYVAAAGGAEVRERVYVTLSREGAAWVVAEVRVGA